MHMSTRTVLKAYYESTRRYDEHEPSWVHPFFEPVLNGSTLGEDHSIVARCIKRGAIEHTSWLGMPRIIDKDGWKVGTTSWMFMRRNQCTPVRYREWTVINATFRGTTYWMAYGANNRVGMSVMTDNSIGPCLSLEEVTAFIDDDKACTG
jgi:hypothetical protein